MLTFKAYSERNKASKGLISVYGVSPEAVPNYLAKAHGKHGFFLDADNRPVLNEAPVEVKKPKSKSAPKPIAESAADGEQAEQKNEDTDPPAQDPFARFAVAQLTAAQTHTETTEDVNKSEAVEKPGIKIQKNREIRNFISRPSEGTVCARVWELADLITEKQNSPILAKELVAVGQAFNINSNTVRTQYTLWRKFYDYEKRYSK